jgi:hypothetical protein
MPDQNGGSPIERSSIEKRIEVLRESERIPLSAISSKSN